MSKIPNKSSNNKLHQIPAVVKRKSQFNTKLNSRVCELYFTQDDDSSYYDVALQITRETGQRITPQNVGRIVKSYGNFYKNLFREEGLL